MKSRVMCVSVLLIFLFSISVVSAIPDTTFSKTKNGVLFSKSVDISNMKVEKSDDSIIISSETHTEGSIKIKQSDIEDIQGSADLLLVSHYNDTGICDYVSIVDPEYKSGYLELDVEFSTIQIQPYLSTLTNWNFETWSDSTHPTGWTTTGSAQSRGSLARMGDYSLLLTGTGASNAFGVQQSVTISTSGYYTIGAFVEIQNSSSGQLVIDVYGGSVDTGGILVSGNTAYRYYQKREYIPAGTYNLRIFAVNTPNSGSKFYVDGVYLSADTSATVTESDDGTYMYQNFTSGATPSGAIIITHFSSYTLSDRGNYSVSVTIDGNPVNCWEANEVIYFEAGGLSAGSHPVVTKVEYKLPPAMLSPLDGSTITFDYPPMYDDVTFTWKDFGNTVCQIQVAEDSAFANVVYSEETATGTATVSLPAGTYYWRVRSYDSVLSVYGDWPTEYSVILVSSSGSITGTGITGTVYYSAGLGNYQYIPGAVVTVYNETYTIQKTTGSVGYYQVLGLTNGTYYISVEADGYDSTSAYAVNVTSGKVSVQDVAMQKEQSYFAPHYVKISVKEKSIFGIIKTPVSDATVTVYENSNTNMLTSQKTGSDGAVGFELSENVRYRIVVEKDGVTQTEYLTPTSSSYEIVLGESNESILPENQFYEVCNISVDKTAVNSSTARIDLSYNDSSENTNLVYFTISRPAGNGTLTLLNTSGSYTENCTTSFYVSDYKGETFTVKVYIDHALFGSVEKSFAVSFSGANLPFAGKSMAILAIIVLFFVGSMFGRGDIGYAGIIVCGLGYFFWFLDIFESLGSEINTTIGVGLLFASIFSIILIFNEKRTEGGI